MLSNQSNVKVTVSTIWVINWHNDTNRANDYQQSVMFQSYKPVPKWSTYLLNISSDCLFNKLISNLVWELLSGQEGQMTPCICYMGPCHLFRWYKLGIFASNKWENSVNHWNFWKWQLTVCDFDLFNDAVCPLWYISCPNIEVAEIILKIL